MQTARFAGLRSVPFCPFPVLTGQWRYARRAPPQVSAPALSPHSSHGLYTEAVMRRASPCLLQSHMHGRKSRGGDESPPEFAVGGR
jgi:hypothetical protein